MIWIFFKIRQLLVFHCKKIILQLKGRIKIMMVKIKWSERFCVNMKEIDEPQKQIVERINIIVDAINSSVDQRETYEMISDLTDFVRHRFSLEEKCMVENHYPDYLSHRKDHREFIRRIIAFRKTFTEECHDSNDDFIKMMEEWLNHHTEEWNSRYVPFLRLQRYVTECNQNRKKFR